MQTGRQRTMQAIVVEWEAGYYLGKKVGAQKEEDSSVRARSKKADSERLGGRDMGRRAGG